jgi:hypothetical protein
MAGRNSDILLLIVDINSKAYDTSCPLLTDPVDHALSSSGIDNSGYHFQIKKQIV